MLPFQRKRPERPPWPTIGVLVALLTLYEIYSWQTGRRREGGTRGTVERLGAPRRTPDAAGRAGDLVLRTADGAALIVAAAPNLPGHRPLLGAIVDVETRRGDPSDPLMSLQTVWLDGAMTAFELPARPPQPFTCADGSAGIRTYGAFGTDVKTETCVVSDGVFSITTTAKSPPAGRSPGDALDVGSHPVVVEGDGAAWNTEHETSFVATASGGTALMIEAPGMRVQRTFSVFGAETFPSPVAIFYGPGEEVVRTLHVVRGDVLHAIARLRTATRKLSVTFGPDRGGTISLRDAAGRELATGTVARGETRQLALPPAFGDSLVLRDEHGVVTDARVRLPEPGGAVHASSSHEGSVTVAYRDASGLPLPVHVLVKGPSGAPDPLPEAGDGRVVAAGRSLYLLDGRARLSLAPGRYRVTASHGMTYSLATSDIEVADGASVAVEGMLRPVLDTSRWVAADFHLHSAPSPDSDVTLEARVQSLACEGVELAVATDHNRVTDLGPAVHALGLGGQLATAPGVEITSMGARFGHFNAYPLPLPSGAPEEGTPVYFGKRPAEMFASARELGARVVQVNHARMAPGIGYFDLVHLDPKTGRADGELSTDFDAFEAYNGMWIEMSDKVREGALDLVALARRGKRVAALGDSDSHKLLYEEAGYPRTFVHVDREPAANRFERVQSALLGAADTLVTSGPFVEITVDGHGPGSVVSPGEGRKLRVSVRVSAPAWVPVEHVEIWQNDTVLERYAVEGLARDGVRFERELVVPIEDQDATLLAWADADTPLPDVVPYEHALAIGFTGLVYVDANHDGTVTVPPRSVEARPSGR